MKNVIRIFCILLLVLFIFCTKENILQPLDYMPIQLEIGQHWKMSGCETVPYFKNYLVKESTNIETKSAYVVKETWIAVTVETAAYTYAYMWDDPLFKIYYKACNSWEAMYAFRLFASGDVIWGYSKTDMIEKDFVKTPYGVVYQNCFKYKCINILNNKESFFWIKEGIGIVKTQNEYGKEEYLVEPPL